MLQPMPVRPLFRLLAVPLALGAIAVGVAAGWFAIQGVRAGEWILALFFFTSVGFGALGALGLVLVATGALPEWVVGHGREDDDAPAAP